MRWGLEQDPSTWSCCVNSCSEPLREQVLSDWSKAGHPRRVLQRIQRLGVAGHDLPGALLSAHFV